MADSTIQETVAAAESFAVDPELCIACDACCQDFPEVFFMGDDQKAHARDTHPSDLYNARTVVEVCPTSAISFSGELPPAEDLAQLDEVDGWELEWAKWRDVEEDLVERDRRYGRDYAIEERDGYVHVAFHFPTKVPAVRNRFRYGLAEQMPRYRSHVAFQEGELLVAGWLTDPKIRSLCHTSKSFPAQFITRLPIEGEILGMSQRYDAHGLLEIVLFTDEEVMDTWQWRSHYIGDKCTACSICERVCPTNAITSGEIYYIDPDLCINCSVCGVYCPFDAIDDSRDITVQRIKAKKIPKAVVHDELCTGCEFCVDICPFDAIQMTPAIEGEFDYQLPQMQQIAEVLPKLCVSCKLCEQVCIKNAIEVPRQHQFENIGMSFMNYVTDNH
ncbi:MAG TPA: 4Fe-4S dicluster domain-containing protein [Planctomycetes bacterium]|nr:4Fe-4S dicluster domain-containing protein [Planctomycetota bacterium]